MRMCIESVSQVLEEKDAHISFPVGMILGPETNQYTRKHLTKTSRDYPRIVPAFSWDFLVILFMCLPFCPRKGQHINKFDPHPFPGQSGEVVYVCWAFVPRSYTQNTINPRTQTTKLQQERADSGSFLFLLWTRNCLVPLFLIISPSFPFVSHCFLLFWCKRWGLGQEIDFPVSSRTTCIFRPETNHNRVRAPIFLARFSGGFGACHSYCLHSLPKNTRILLWTILLKFWPAFRNLWKDNNDNFRIFELEHTFPSFGAGGIHFSLELGKYWQVWPLCKLETGLG